MENPAPKNVSITVEDIILNCTVNGFPIPSISWFHNSTDIEKDNRSRVTVTTYHLMEQTGQEMDFGIVVSNLVISNAGVNDTGLYQCQADTRIQDPVVSDEVTILVQGIQKDYNNYWDYHNIIILIFCRRS